VAGRRPLRFSGRAFVADRVRAGRRSGGIPLGYSSNVTGFMHFEPSMVGKCLEVLKEVAPSITRGAVIFDPNNPASNV
jgi:hypothetical protein